MVKYIIINMYIYDLFRLNVIGAIRCHYEGHKQGRPAGQTVVLTYIGRSAGLGYTCNTVSWEGEGRWEVEEQTQELPIATGNNKNNTNNNSTASALLHVHMGTSNRKNA